MPFFKPWERRADSGDEPKQVRSHDIRAEGIMQTHEQLRRLSVYGIGGCSVIKLNDDQMKLWHEFAMGRSNDLEGTSLLLAMAIPKAYKAVMQDGKDCTSYFFGEHNERVRQTKTTESQIRLCLAREGNLLDILDRAKAGRLLMTNTQLLRSAIGKSLNRIGLINTKDGCTEHAFLDFVPDARAGDCVVLHRNVACETSIDDGGGTLF